MAPAWAPGGREPKLPQPPGARGEKMQVLLPRPKIWAPGVRPILVPWFPATPLIFITISNTVAARAEDCARRSPNLKTRELALSHEQKSRACCSSHAQKSRSPRYLDQGHPRHHMPRLCIIPVFISRCKSVGLEIDLSPNPLLHKLTCCVGWMSVLTHDIIIVGIFQ